MNTTKSSNNLYALHKSYPQMESLFSSLNISETERNNIQIEFYRIAKTVYEDSQGISNDIIKQIKLGETHRDCFEIKNEFENNILNQYFNFIQKYPQGEKIWRILSAYYTPSQS